jgi:hypothetical protein
MYSYNYSFRSWLSPSWIDVQKEDPKLISIMFLFCLMLANAAKWKKTLAVVPNMAKFLSICVSPSNFTLLSNYPKSVLLPRRGNLKFLLMIVIPEFVLYYSSFIITCFSYVCSSFYSSLSTRIYSRIPITNFSFCLVT